MDPFRCIKAPAAPIEGADIDTDQILPARFMHKRRLDYGRYCFHDLRFDKDGRLHSGFVLNKPEFRDVVILVTDRNFGCGSSREQAVHTLVDFGIRSIIAPSFGDIFHTNCLKNGLLPLTLDEGVVRDLRTRLSEAPGLEITVDLQNERVTTPDGAVHGFSADPFGRTCLLEGFDEIDYTLTHLAKIRAFEDARS